MVEIPVERSLPGGFQPFEESLLNGMEQVETHKDIVLVLEFLRLVFDHLPVESPLVGEVLAGEAAVEAVVDVAHL